jgi:two-component system chemotaxis response regulator CheB
VIGVVLSGALDAGASGVSVIKARGGLAVVQDPEDALHPGMPESAPARVEVDRVLPAKEMGAELALRVRETVDGTDAPPLSLVDEVEVQAAGANELEATSLPEVVDVTKPSGFACPDCQGVLFSLDDRGLRFRCRVGHAWTGQTLFQQQSQEIEQALWAAFRALEEKRDLAAKRGGRRGGARLLLATGRYVGIRPRAPVPSRWCGSSCSRGWRCPVGLWTSCPASRPDGRVRT